MRNLGVEVSLPKKTCNDKQCPFHGHLSIRGRIFEGIVEKKKARKMVVITREYLHYVKKYLRYERRRSKIHAYLPPCLDIREGEKVKIAECRPLAKTVSFVIIEKIGG
ncbi:MAG: 30S ribosomal protein S17 [Nitrososphaerales archaeon]